MADFKKLLVWQRTRAFNRSVYQLTRDFASGEMADLTSQLRRAALSVPTNIAEGCARQTDREQARFFRISLASARELESLLISANDVEIITGRQFEPLAAEIDEIQRMLHALIRHRLRASVRNRRVPEGNL